MIFPHFTSLVFTQYYFNYSDDDEYELVIKFD